MSEQTKPRIDVKKGAKRAGAVVGVLMAGAAMVGCSAEAKPAPTVTAIKTVEAPSHNESIDNNKELRERATNGAVNVAIGLLDILDDKKSTTTEAYGGNVVGTKDAKRPANVPEMTVSFDQEAGEMYLLATNGYDTESGKTTPGFAKGPDNESFTSITMTLTVDRINPINDIHRQLTTTDFRKALSMKDTVALKSAQGSWFELGIPGTRGYNIKASSTGFETVVVEDTSSSGYIPSVESPKTDPATLDRALQIMGASVESFKNDMKR